MNKERQCHDAAGMCQFEGMSLLPDDGRDTVSLFSFSLSELDGTSRKSAGLQAFSLPPFYVP